MRNIFNFISLPILIIIGLFFVQPIYAFSLDSTFGVGGIINTSIHADLGKKIVLQSDGKILLGGSSLNVNYPIWSIGRYNTDGNIDKNFGINGIITKDFGFASNINGGVAEQSNGKTIIVGDNNKNGTGNNILIGRINLDGSVDTTFGTNGFTSSQIDGASSVILFNVAVQQDNKILAVGYKVRDSGNHSDLLLVRYDANGNLDQTFGNGGIVLADYPFAQYHQADALAIQSDGKILIYGSLGGVGGDPLILYRFNNNGSLDTTFGNNGYIQDHFGPKYDEPNDIVIQSDGKILVTGVTAEDFFINKTIFVIRYNADGSRDTNFANGGLFTNSFGSNDSFVTTITLQTDGKILIGGADFDGSKHNLALRRLNMNGTLDTNFGVNGSFITDLGTNSYIQTLLFQNDGKLIAGIVTTDGNWGVVRYSEKTNISLDVPLFKQTSNPWQSQEYDSAHVWNPSDPTINAWGCAMTSAAMVFKYYGINKLPSGIALDPGTLNTWLKNQPDGYVGQGLLNWLSLSRLSKLATAVNKISTFDALEYQRIQGANTNQLSTDLTNAIPAILEEPGHFIVAKGITDASFTINDPYYNRTTLQDGYNNTFLSFGKYVPSHTDLSYIMAVSDQDIVIKLLDGQNNEFGSEFSQQPISNPLNTSQSNGQPMHLFYFQKPANGTYKIMTSSTKNKEYQINFYLYDKNGNVLPIQQNSFITSTMSNQFNLNFNIGNIKNATIAKSVSFQSIMSDIQQAEKSHLILPLIGDNLIGIVINIQKNAKNKFIAQQYSNAGLLLLDKTRKTGMKEDGYQIIHTDLLGLKMLLSI